MLLSVQRTADAFTQMKISGAIYLDPVLNHDARRGKLDAFHTVILCVLWAFWLMDLHDERFYSWILLPVSTCSHCIVFLCLEFCFS